MPLEDGLTPQDALRAIGDQPWPFALTGESAGWGAILGSSPVIVADADSDPFALLDGLPSVARRPASSYCSGRRLVRVVWAPSLGRRIEILPEGSLRPVALPEFHLAYYDHVLRLDPHGQWWFEALVSAGAEERISRRLEELHACVWRRQRAIRRPSTLRPRSLD